MSAVLLLLLHLTHTCASSIEEQLQNAAGNTTILKETTIQGWTNSPSFRGSAGILWSCLVTILASIYTAIHPNIPVRRISKWRRFGYKLKWVLIALLAPEYIIGRTALRQYRAARQLIRHLNTSQDASASSAGAVANSNSDESARPEGKHHTYSMAYGFWVEMGGFVVKTSEISREHQFVALTAKGAILLAEAGYFFDISDEQIADRSKSNALGKLLVCFQVLWMLLQCITRASVGYPLTLLEIHTMVHVFFAICMYILWWHKPLDVDEPIVIDGTEFGDILSLFMMATVQKGYYSELHHLQFFKNQTSGACDCQGMQGNDQQHTVISNDMDRKEYPADPQGNSLLDEPMSLFITEDCHLSCGIGPRESSRLLGKEDIRRWCLCAQGLSKLQPREIEFVHGKSLESVAPTYGYTLTTESTSNSTSGVYWALHDFKTVVSIALGTDSFSEFLLGIFILPVVYSGIHLSAIATARFPSTVEAILWYTSAGAAVGVPSLCFLFFLFLISTESLFDVRSGGLYSHMVRTGTAIAAIGMCISQLCRLYLVVESFISLRDVPLGAFATTPWLQAIPHL